jgi:hypothetical protein
MITTIKIGKKEYKVTDEETMRKEDELIFEIRNRNSDENTYVLGMWEDLLGAPIKKIWKIIP